MKGYSVTFHGGIEQYVMICHDMAAHGRTCQCIRRRLINGKKACKVERGGVNCFRGGGILCRWDKSLPGPVKS